ncbi:hypothetical protein FGO68_gene12821 [Halteria grandinella]|uniref:Uncharacterized protein n=1 Tax=Halteria grandinella TaxID=5974 RepID=A0A8J8SUL1_HALGN|nr:hypothetical protein FGO68_gene12821 [Halteria grandinella]
MITHYSFHTNYYCLSKKPLSFPNVEFINWFFSCGVCISHAAAYGITILLVFSPFLSLSKQSFLDELQPTL